MRKILVLQGLMELIVFVLRSCTATQCVHWLERGRATALGTTVCENHWI